MEAKPTTRRFEWKRFNNIVKKSMSKRATSFVPLLSTSSLSSKFRVKPCTSGFFLLLNCFGSRKHSYLLLILPNVKLEYLLLLFIILFPSKIVKWRNFLLPQIWKKNIKFRGCLLPLLIELLKCSSLKSFSFISFGDSTCNANSFIFFGMIKF